MFGIHPPRSSERRRLITVVLGLLIASVAVAAGSPGAVATTEAASAVHDGAVQERPLVAGSSVADAQLDAPATATAAITTDAETAPLRFDYAPSPQTVHLGVFSVLTVLTGALGYWITSTRRTRGGHLFGIALAVLAVRTGIDVVHGLVGDLWTLQRILVTTSPLLEVLALAVFCWFAARYAGDDRLTACRSRRAIAGLLAVTAIALATNPLHALVIADYSHLSNPFAYVGFEPGPLWWLLTALEGGLLLVGAGLLARSFTVTDRPSWWAAATLAMAISIALVVGGASALGDGPLAQYDYTAAGLAGFALVTAIPLLSHGLRRIEITARESIIQEMDDAIVVLDDARTVVDYNDAAARLLPDLATGSRFAAHFQEPPALPVDGGTATSEVSDATLSGRTAGAADADDSSSRRHYLVQSTAVTTATADTLGYTIRFADVTDLRRRTAELERTNERLDRFASTVTYDLRAPLTAATDSVDWLVDTVRSSARGESLDGEAINTRLQRVAASLERMRTMIDDILTLARDTDVVTDTSPRSFERTVDTAWDALETEAASLTVDGTGTIEADHDRLQRLLENLFRNCVEHAGPSVSIVAGLSDDGFYVADDGPGIPPDEREAVLEYGYSGTEDGTGLGLAVVAQLADAHGWGVTVTDSADGGTRVEISGCTIRGAVGEPTAEH